MSDVTSFGALDEDDLEFKPTNRRVSIGRDILKERLDHYAAASGGEFEATEEHLDVLVAIFHEHRNVFLTGGAGVGKTALLRSVIMKELDYRNLHWSVTAMTGIAGSHLDGKTANSFFGVGLGPQWDAFVPTELREYLPEARPGAPTVSPQNMSEEELNAWYSLLFQRWMNDKNVRPHTRVGIINRLKSHEVVILDEVSMMRGSALLGYLDFKLRELRGNSRPFGGLQFIFAGDFAQLPPVEQDIKPGEKTDWAFLSRVWDRAGVKPIELTRVFRQGDPEFIGFLNTIRLGGAVDKTYINRFRRDLAPGDFRKFTKLIPLRAQAKTTNMTALLSYPGPTTTLEAFYRIEPKFQNCKAWERKNPIGVKAALSKCMGLTEPSIYVRVGLPVMFTVNDPDGEFVNGTRGFIREISIDSLPWENYVVIGIQGKPGECEVEVKLFRRTYSRTQEQDPKARVATGGADGLPPKISLYPTVSQFPIIPATGITIHKAQGLSMDRAIVDLGQSFAAGQVYVGLSRLRSTDGLVITGGDFEAKTDPEVLKFYRKIAERRKMSKLSIPDD